MSLLEDGRVGLDETRVQWEIEVLGVEGEDELVQRASRMDLREREEVAGG